MDIKCLPILEDLIYAKTCRCTNTIVQSIENTSIYLCSVIITEEDSNSCGSICILVSRFGGWKTNNLPIRSVWFKNIMYSKILK